MKMNNLMPAIAIALGTAAVALPATAQERPYVQADDSWISIDGTVEAVRADAFLLDYGPGVITVEMDDGDRDADAYKLMKGDKVRVRGVVDDDFFETTKIEASSVYVENLGTYFFSSAVDEEDRVVVYLGPVDVSATTAKGTVTDVDESNQEFTLNTGALSVGMQVDVEQMPYDPLDDVGYQQIEVGDRVVVAGELGADIFDPRRELVADSVLVVGHASQN